MHRTVCSGKSLTSQQENYEKLMSVLNSSGERETAEDSPTKGDNNNKHQGTATTHSRTLVLQAHTPTHTQQIDLSISVYVLNWKSSADTNGCD